MSLETYLKVCEQLGQEPDPNRMPPTAEDFPYEVQVAFFIHDMLPPKIEGMSGTYMGRDINPLSFLYDIYEVEDKKCITDMIMRINTKYINHFQKKADVERKKQERKARASTPVVRR